jgi:hypothetical protein
MRGFCVWGFVVPHSIPSNLFARIASVLGDEMPTQISPMLAVTDGNAAIKFYKAAFGATVLWSLGDDHVVAGLSINGAEFFLATESPQ